jgi:drug/metabolite transporter (DMT)-like permease
MPDRSAHLAGIGLMLLATIMFSLNDALGKWLVATYSVGQILLIRSASAFVMLAPFVIRAGAEPFRQAPRPALQMGRVVLSTAEVACFYLAVWYMPLADAMTFYLAGPIYVTALSAVFLREKVGVYRWSAVLIGFVGVLTALQPFGRSLGTGALIAIAGSVAYAVLMIVTRRLKETPNVVLTGMQALGALIFGAVAAPLTWTPVRGTDYLLLFLLGAVSIVAIGFVNQSLRLAPASIVVPYQYTLIVWAVILGYLVFGDVPRLNVIVGAAIIVASGLFIFLREQRLARSDGQTALPDR